MLNKNEIGLSLLRVMLGLVFLANGVAKFQGGIENTVGWFDSIGIPGFLAYVVAIIELVGGIALILGVGTRIVSVLIGFIMLGAIFTVKLPAGFLNGSKLYSLDNLLFKGQKDKDSFPKSV